MSAIVTLLGTGKCSSFGGKDDTGVGSTEGLALIQNSNLTEWWFRRIFVMPGQWDNSKGLARNLDPAAFYIAMRWNELNIAVDVARRASFRLSANGKSVMAQGADYGPGDGKMVDGVQDPDTGRLVDCAPGILDALGIKTDDLVTVEMIS